MKKYIISLGALNVLLAVAAGAFAAHALKNHLSPNALTTFKTAINYQMIHGFGLILIGILAQILQRDSNIIAAIFMFLGIVLFCGSLYLWVLFQIKWLVFITPLGGICFLLAWAILGFSYYPSK